MSSATQSKEALLASDTALVAGMQKDLENTATLMVAGQSTTPAQAITVVQGRITTANAVLTARVAYAKAVAAHEAELAQTQVFVGALRQLLLAMFLTHPDKLADFGLSPRKTGTKTVVTKMIAAQRNLATRRERGTVGKKAKMKIKGSIGPTIIISTSGQPSVSSAPGSPVPLHVDPTPPPPPADTAHVKAGAR